MSFVQQLIGQIANANKMDVMKKDSEIPVMAAEPRKGMFGIKGQARDILGLIGDAFLVQGGAKPLYREQKLNEQMADALRDYGTDELGAISALASVPGAAELVQEMMDNYHQNEVRRGTLENTRRKTAAEIDEKQLEREGIVLGRVASMMDSVKNDPAAWTLMRQQALQYAAGKNVPLPWEIPTTPTDSLVYREVSPKENVQLQDTRAWRDATVGVKREELAEEKRSNNVKERDQAIRTAATTAGIASETAKRLDDIQNPKGKKARRDAPIKLKEGDPIWKDGKKYIIKNGKPVPAK